MQNPNISTSLHQMPEYLSTQHLIQLGIYPSIDAAYQARVKGYSPRYIKLRHKVLYAKQSVIEFLENRTIPGDLHPPAQSSPTQQDFKSVENMWWMKQIKKGTFQQKSSNGLFRSSKFLFKSIAESELPPQQKQKREKLTKNNLTP